MTSNDSHRAATGYSAICAVRAGPSRCETDRSAVATVAVSNENSESSSSLQEDGLESKAGEQGGQAEIFASAGSDCHKPLLVASGAG